MAQKDSGAQLVSPDHPCHNGRAVCSAWSPRSLLLCFDEHVDEDAFRKELHLRLVRVSAVGWFLAACVLLAVAVLTRICGRSLQIISEEDVLSFDSTVAVIAASAVALLMAALCLLRMRCGFFTVLNLEVIDVTVTSLLLFSWPLMTRLDLSDVGEASSEISPEVR
eukprot:gnl/TRDRNA2_/TRDRNA2_89503_c0_seq2.p2 gnl/TRDRNA2_/TRDRNA2_89503_c0~~gnl/TRDRNA2_/TRDRNA2_89503_c0_seq2.p2  ORF type:complete len:166 (+),score=19.37 gnl/TRDRNA2_/TRDRNA2_89503_c0_seq2:1-498(+)